MDIATVTTLVRVKKASHSSETENSASRHALVAVTTGTALHPMNALATKVSLSHWTGSVNHSVAKDVQTANALPQKSATVTKDMRRSIKFVNQFVQGKN